MGDVTLEQDNEKHTNIQEQWYTRVWCEWPPGTMNGFTQITLCAPI